MPILIWSVEYWTSRREIEHFETHVHFVRLVGEDGETSRPDRNDPTRLQSQQSL